MFPKPIAKAAPYAKFIVALLTAVGAALTVPLGSPLWLTFVLCGLNAIGVLLTPNAAGEYEYREPENPAPDRKA